MTRRAITRAGGGAAAAAAILVIDTFIWQEGVPRPVLGLLDEFSHVATVLLVLWMAGLADHRLLRNCLLVGAIAIDADHIPGELGSDVITAGQSRPYSHSAITVAVLLLVAAVATRRPQMAIVGVALGVALHLPRDMATGGVPLWWPLRDTAVQFPHVAYAAAIVVAAGVGAWRTLSPRRMRARNGLQDDPA